MSSTVENAAEIRPYPVDMPDEAIAASGGTSPRRACPARGGIARVLTEKPAGG